MKKVIKIDGMGCQHCVKNVANALENVSGVKVLEVKIGEATVEIAEDFDMSIIVEALDDAGYEVV
ncbi:heavy-metal-associated domain-containing protein [uncultured Fusobacterium sp.]|uniref:heavy-metal-associated domain-containing protein n=1 Tax=uncultured Fusobacterium sp. TaxID=159267 RepID=UPI0025EA4DFC|nr:heavy-metal-associated domain-containing protein [uncultured Fusobacterium sp.]